MKIIKFLSSLEKALLFILLLGLKTSARCVLRSYAFTRSSMAHVLLGCFKGGYEGFSLRAFFVAFHIELSWKDSEAM